jgi:hypothetical protein
VSDGIVELGSFQDEASAYLARAALAASGIRSEVVAMHAYALPVPKVRLAVREQDAAAALGILNSLAGGPSA